MHAESDQLLDRLAVAAMFGRSTKTLKRWERDQDLGFPKPATVIRNRTYWRIEDLRAFMRGTRDGRDAA